MFEEVPLDLDWNQMLKNNRFHELFENSDSESWEYSSFQSKEEELPFFEETDEEPIVGAIESQFFSTVRERTNSVNVNRLRMLVEDHPTVCWLESSSVVCFDRPKTNALFKRNGWKLTSFERALKSSLGMKVIQSTHGQQSIKKWALW